MFEPFELPLIQGAELHQLFLLFQGEHWLWVAS
jgi:hypothetical protein